MENSSVVSGIYIQCARAPIVSHMKMQAAQLLPMLARLWAAQKYNYSCAGDTERTRRVWSHLSRKMQTTFNRITVSKPQQYNISKVDFNYNDNDNDNNNNYHYFNK